MIDRIGGMRNSLVLQIKEEHLDFYEHVNNAEVMKILEEGRWHYLEQGGFTREFVKREGTGSVVLEAKIRYRRELKLGDNVEIETFLKGTKKKLQILGQRILRQGELCIEAEILSGLFDLNRRKLIPPTEAWKKGIGLV